MKTNMTPPKNRMRPVHPGEVLREEFLVPMDITPHGLSMALHVPAPRVNDIVRERRAVTADTAMRLAQFFGMSAEFWMGLQSDYELALTRAKLGKELKAIKPYARPAATPQSPTDSSSDRRPAQPRARVHRSRA